MPKLEGFSILRPARLRQFAREDPRTARSVLIGCAIGVLLTVLVIGWYLNARYPPLSITEKERLCETFDTIELVREEERLGQGESHVEGLDKDWIFELLLSERMPDSNGYLTAPRYTADQLEDAWEHCGR